MEEWSVYLLADYECSGRLIEECRKLLSAPNSSGESAGLVDEQSPGGEKNQREEIGGARRATDGRSAAGQAAKGPSKRNAAEGETGASSSGLLVEWRQLIEKDEEHSVPVLSLSNNNIILASQQQQTAVLKLCSSLHRLVRLVVKLVALLAVNRSSRPAYSVEPLARVSEGERH